jgi:RarD protein
MAGLSLAKPAADRQSITLVAVGAICYSTLILFTRWISGLEATSIAFFRMLFAFLFFCVLLVWFPQAARVSAYRRAIPRLALLGALMATTASLYIYAIQHTTAANAALLVNSAPVYIAFLGPLVLKERPPRYGWISLGLVIVGVALITEIGELRFEAQGLGGISAAALAGFVFAWMLMLSRSLPQEVDGFTQTWWGTGIATFCLLPFALGSDLSAAGSNLGLLIPMGVITMGIASVTYYIALRRLKAQVVSVVAILEPVAGVFIGLLVFREPMSTAGLVGSGLVLLAIYLISVE